MLRLPFGTFPRADSGLTVHKLPSRSQERLSSHQWLRRTGQVTGHVAGAAGAEQLAVAPRACLTRFIRTLRRSREFRTKGGFLDSVELSLSLRFSCKEKAMDVQEGPSARRRHTRAKRLWLPPPSPVLSLLCRRRGPVLGRLRRQVPRTFLSFQVDVHRACSQHNAHGHLLCAW